MMLRTGVRGLVAMSRQCSQLTPRRATSLDEQGDLLVASEASKQPLGAIDIDWDAAMNKIKSVERSHPLPQISPEEKDDIVSKGVTYNLAKIIQDSETLRGLVDLGVGIWKWEQTGLMDMAVTLDLHRDVMPRVKLIREMAGVSPEEIAALLTNCGTILQVDPDHLYMRMDYLLARGFSKAQVRHIVTDSYYWLNEEVERIDRRLAYLQNHFKLTDKEVVAVAVRGPQLVTWSGLPSQVGLNRLVLKDFGALKAHELKQLLLDCPTLYMAKHQDMLVNSFGFLYDEVGYSKELILKSPETLLEPLRVKRPRLEFLRQLRRDQFDASKAGFVSPRGLMLTEEKDFCKKVAKVPLRLYEKYLKTL